MPSSRATENAIREATGRKGQVTCRFTHVYPDGPAPYFTFHALGEPGKLGAQWRIIKSAALDAVIANGGTVTHHHAVGRDHRPWYDRQRPPLFADALARRQEGARPARPAQSRCADRSMTFRPDQSSPRASKFVPSPNHDARESRDRHPAAALHRHADGRGGARAAQRPRGESLVATTSSTRTAASPARARKRGAPGMRASDRGRAPSTSIRARSASRSSIRATNSAIAIFPTRRSMPSSRSAATSSTRRHIPRERVLGHSDVAPARKKDPGEKFPWAKLAAAGVGFWVDPAPITEGRTLSANDRGAPVEDLQKQLIKFGYGLADFAPLRRCDARGRHRVPAPFPARARRRARRPVDRGDAAPSVKDVAPHIIDSLRKAPTSTASVGRTAAWVQCRKAASRGKSGLHGHAVPDNVRREKARASRRQAQGKCHRK